MDDVKTYLNSAEEKMAMAIEFLDEALAHIRAGKANPRILDGIRVDYYGSLAPLSNVSQYFCPRCTYHRYYPLGKIHVQSDRESHFGFRIRHYSRK